MSRYRGPRLRIVRRLGNLPGFTRKVSMKKNPPGQHQKPVAQRKLSEYNVRLREKQKLRYNYGITEKQLLNYVKKSRKLKGSSGEILLTLLEMRLDNIVYRLGMAPTILAARQMVSHGHILVNDGSVNIPSYECKPNDTIKVKAKKASRKLVETNLEMLGDLKVPEHLAWNANNLFGEVKSVIQRNWVLLQINELLVVEYYSRKV